MRRIVLTLAVLALIAAACSDDPASDSSVATTLPSTTTTTFGGTTTTAGTGVGATTTTAAPALLPEGGTVRTFFAPGPHGANLLLEILTDFGGANPSGWFDVLHGNVASGVWRYDGNTGELVPDLVVELPSLGNGGLTLNADGTLTVRYEIHPDAVWSDGVPVSGEDFAFTHETLIATIDRLDAEEGAPLVTTCGKDLRVLVTSGGREHVKVVPGSIKAGSKSFEYSVTSPGAYNEQLFAVVVPKHAVEGTDFVTDWIDSVWPSASPFVVESFDRLGQRMVLARNPNYWRVDPETGQRLPHIDRFEVGLPPEIAERMPDSVEFDEDGDPSTPPVVVDRLREFNELAWLCSSPTAWDRMGIDRDSSEAANLEGAWFQAVIGIETELFAEGVIVDAFVREADSINAFREGGFDVQAVSLSTWEHIAFHYGDGRLVANPDSLVEHVEFRRAIAHAIDRDRIAAEAPAVPARRIDGIIEAFSTSLAAPGADRFRYDPALARTLIRDLCAELGRDCEADPPSLVFPYDTRLAARGNLAVLITEMLADVGVVVDASQRGLFQIFLGCEGWEATTFAWQSSPGFAAFRFVYEVFDPDLPPQSADGEALTTLYAWGTDAVEGISDDPWFETPDCDESTIWNQGPSSVRDEFTERYARLNDDLQAAIDREEQLRIVNELEAILADQAVYIPLYLRPAGHARRSDLVGGIGYAIQFSNEPRFWNLEEWYVIEPQPGT